MTDTAWKNWLRAKLRPKQKGLCFWCKRPMSPPPFENNRPPQEGETLDHIYDRLHPRRGVCKQVFVLSCYACNHSRGAQSERQANPDLKQLRARLIAIERHWRGWRRIVIMAHGLVPPDNL